MRRCGLSARAVAVGKLIESTALAALFICIGHFYPRYAFSLPALMTSDSRGAGPRLRAARAEAGASPLQPQLPSSGSYRLSKEDDSANGCC